jgi:hypothetical protein
MREASTRSLQAWDEGGRKGMEGGDGGAPTLVAVVYGRKGRGMV